MLANVVRKPMRQIFSEFGGVMPSGADYGTGDVKYHLGTSYDRPTISGKRVHLSLLANPSHLEVSRPPCCQLACSCTHCELDFANPLGEGDLVEKGMSAMERRVVRRRQTLGRPEASRLAWLACCPFPTCLTALVCWPW